MKKGEIIMKAVALERVYTGNLIKIKNRYINKRQQQTQNRQSKSLSTNKFFIAIFLLYDIAKEENDEKQRNNINSIGNNNNNFIDISGDSYRQYNK